MLCAGEEIFDIHVAEEEEEDHEADSKPQHTRSGLHEKAEKAEEGASSQFFLMEESQLLRMAGAYHKVCPVCQEEPLNIQINPSGTAAHIHWVSLLKVLFFAKHAVYFLKVKHAYSSSC